MALSDKTSSSVPVDEALAQVIRSRLDAEGRLPCAAAFVVAAERDVVPLLVGQAADGLGVRLTRCQLGLFGYPGHAKGWDVIPPETPIPEEWREAILAVAVEGGISCRELWALAARLGISRLLIGYIADQLGLKVRECQLGAF